ncbi:MAG: transketolase [Clostridiaceae bacterium]|jgi:transketolase|nr:transketolase [Clostridiaceae bacterium]
MEQKEILSLKKTATNIRKGILRATCSAGSGHPGGSLSITDIMTYLYFKEMNIDPKEPKNPDRDRFVMSKGHCAPVLYSTLAERGFFPVEDLETLRKTDSYLEGHPHMRTVPGVDMSTGSLAQGMSAAVGMALAGKIDNKDYRVFVGLGDGELEEGLIWEASMAAAHYKLDNMICFVDYNGLQIDGKITDVMNPEPIADKFEAFGWYVQSIDAHDYEQIEKAIENAKNQKGKPNMIVAHSIKGKGVSFMEGQAGWHGVAPKPEERDRAIAELDEYLASLDA